MELQEVLWKLLSEAKCPDGFADANNEERATHLAPIIERALREAYRAGVQDQMDKLGNTSDNGVTAGVAAMMEER